MPQGQMNERESLSGAGMFPQEMSAGDHVALTEAVALLERTSFAMRLTNMVGHKLDLIGQMVPARFSTLASKAASVALKAALHSALTTLDSRKQRPPSPRLHKALAAASGAAGGLFGLNSLPVELPVSTGLILRSIADIARAQGEDLASPEAALACLEVFALGGRNEGASALDENLLMHEGSYFAVRTLLAKSLTEAARYVLERGIAEETAPVIVRLVAMIAARFGMVVTQKAMAQAIPVIGAAGGAAINFAFMQHFQALAHGHFTVRRLERVYGASQVRDAYQQIRLADAGNKAKPI